MLTASKKIFGTLLCLSVMVGALSPVSIETREETDLLYFSLISVNTIYSEGNPPPAPKTIGNPPPSGPKSTSLVNPLKFDSIEGLFVGILSALMVIMMPIIVFFIIYAGFLYVTARGNAEQVKKATSALTYAVIGGVIVIGALAIAQIVKGIIEPFAK